MKPRPRVGALILMFLLVVVTGCATKPSPVLGPSRPPSLDELGSFRTIGIAVEVEALKPVISGPIRAKDAARKGALEGAKATFFGALRLGLCTAGGREVGVVLCLSSVAAGAVLTPVGAAVGATVQAIRAEPTSVIEGALPILRNAIDDTAVLGTVRDHLVKVNPSRLVILEEDLAGRSEGQAVDARLDLSVEGIGLFAVEGGVNPRLALVLTVKAELASVREPRVLRVLRERWERPGGRLSSWTANDGHRLREELHRATAGIAAKIAADVCATCDVPQ